MSPLRSSPSASSSSSSSSALLAPQLAPQDPSHLNLAARMLAPTHGHLLGTDELGRDILSRILFGARISLVVALSGRRQSRLHLASSPVSCPASMAASSTQLSTSTSPTPSSPCPAFSSPSPLSPFSDPASSTSSWRWRSPAGCPTRASFAPQVMAVRQREFVEAARALGASDLRLMLRHILPNILQPLIVQAAIGMAAPSSAEATLFFPRPRHPRSCSLLGFHAQRRPLPPLRRSPHGRLPRPRRHGSPCSPSTCSATPSATSSTHAQPPEHSTSVVIQPRTLCDRALCCHSRRESAVVLAFVSR